MEKRAIVEAAAFRSITVVLKHGLVRAELLMGLLCCHLEDDDHEGTHQESSVHHLVAWFGCTAVVEDAVLLIRLVSQKSGKLSRVSMNHREIKRPKVLVEREVLQIIVDVEEESIFEVCWRLQIRDPVQFVYKVESN